MDLLGECAFSFGFVPCGFLYSWNPPLSWFYTVSGTLTALVYFATPFVLFQLLRKTQLLPSKWMFGCFGVFLFACGAAHLLNIWNPENWFSGGVKLIAVLAAIPTAVLLVRLVSQGGRVPSLEAIAAANEDLKRQDASLKKSEERFQQMANNIQEIFWMMNAETKEATYVSPAFEQICEVPLESIYSNPISYRELIHPEDRTRVLGALEKLANANRFDEEFRIVCPSGTVKWLRAIGFQAVSSSGDVQTLVGTVQEITARKLMEVALRESEDLFRDLVEHSSDLICTHTLDGRILSINELPARLLGYTREEVLAKPMRDFLLPEARAQFDQSLKTIQRDGFVKGLMVVLTKTGEKRIWEYHNTLRKDGVSVPIVRGIAHDVTEQKRVERALRLSEEKFSKAFLASPYPIVISTIEEGRFLEVNDSFLRLSGFTREEAVGRTSGELGLWTSADDREKILSEIEKQGRVNSRQIIVQAKSGNQFVVNYSAEVIEVGSRKCLLCVCEDVTDRERADTRLREYEKAVEGVEEMIAVVDRNYRYLLANRAFLDFKGLAREQVVGHLVSEILENSFFELLVKDKLDEALSGKIVNYEAAYDYLEKGKRDIQISYFPIEGSAGIERVVCVLRDITELKRAEQELRRISGQLLKLQDEERRKIARDLHDSTGQDLVALATSLSQLRNEIPAEHRKWRRLLSDAQAVANRCLSDVRTLSYVLHPPMLDETGLADAVRHFAKGFGTRTGISLEIDIAPHFGRLSPDMELGLFRVVQESLSNIQRHSGSDSAKIELNREKEKITLRVSDAGRGILPNKIERGQRSQLTPTVCGVGIPSMQERVSQVGGQMEIETSDLGTSVCVTVPIYG